jgi:hypothetical protein
MCIGFWDLVILLFCYFVFGGYPYGVDYLKINLSIVISKFENEHTYNLRTNANLITPHSFAFELVLEYLNLKITKSETLEQT